MATAWADLPQPFVRLLPKVLTALAKLAMGHSPCAASRWTLSDVIDDGGKGGFLKIVTAGLPGVSILRTPEFGVRRAPHRG
jgi:hypothetical protein